MAHFTVDDRNKTDSKSNQPGEQFVHRTRAFDGRTRAAYTISRRATEQRRTAPIISDTGACIVLESYTGLIEAIEGGHIFLTLYADGEYYELDLFENVFTPGNPMEVGCGVEAKLIQRRDDTVAWTARVLPPEPIDFEGLEELSEKKTASMNSGAIRC